MPGASYLSASMTEVGKSLIIGGYKHGNVTFKMLTHCVVHGTFDDSACLKDSVFTAIRFAKKNRVQVGCRYQDACTVVTPASVADEVAERISFINSAEYSIVQEGDVIKHDCLCFTQFDGASPEGSILNAHKVSRLLGTHSNRGSSFFMVMLPTASDALPNVITPINYKTTFEDNLEFYKKHRNYVRQLGPFHIASAVGLE